MDKKQKKKVVKISSSKFCIAVLSVLQKEGYILSFNVVKFNFNSFINVYLKYINNSPVIRNISRVSKPGRRVYSGIKELKAVCNGLGISVLSTSKGVFSDYDARLLNVGGEVLCSVL